MIVNKTIPQQHMLLTGDRERFKELLLKQTYRIRVEKAGATACSGFYQEE